MTPRAAILDYANEGLRGGNLNVSIKICLLYAPKRNSAKGNLCTIICSVFWLIKPTIIAFLDRMHFNTPSIQIRAICYCFILMLNYTDQIDF